MKKWIALTLTAALLVCCFVFAACGGVTGKYRFYSFSKDGVTVQVGTKIEGVVITDDYITVEMKDDNTYVMTSMGAGSTGTWEEAGEGIYRFTEDESEYNYTVNVQGKTMTILDDDITFVLKK